MKWAPAWLEFWGITCALKQLEGWRDGWTEGWLGGWMDGGWWGGGAHLSPPPPPASQPLDTRQPPRCLTFSVFADWSAAPAARLADWLRWRQRRDDLLRREKKGVSACWERSGSCELSWLCWSPRSPLHRPESARTHRRNLEGEYRTGGWSGAAGSPSLFPRRQVPEPPPPPLLLMRVPLFSLRTFIHHMDVLDACLQRGVCECVCRVEGGGGGGPSRLSSFNLALKLAANATLARKLDPRGGALAGEQVSTWPPLQGVEVCIYARWRTVEMLRLTQPPPPPTPLLSPLSLPLSSPLLSSLSRCGVSMPETAARGREVWALSPGARRHMTPPRSACDSAGQIAFARFWWKLRIFLCRQQPARPCVSRRTSVWLI